jgi:hypothetical protein
MRNSTKYDIEERRRGKSFISFSIFLEKEKYDLSLGLGKEGKAPS